VDDVAGYSGQPARACEPAHNPPHRAFIDHEGAGVNILQRCGFYDRLNDHWLMPSRDSGNHRCVATAGLASELSRHAGCAVPSGSAGVSGLVNIPQFVGYRSTGRMS
jgi:hypothetical protein